MQCSILCQDLKREMEAGRDLCKDHGLQLLTLSNAVLGSVTDSQHLLGLGHDLRSSVTPAVKAGLPCTVRHVLDGGVEGKFPTVLVSALPQVVNPPRAVLLHEGVVRPESLFLYCFPNSRIYALSHKMALQWVVCGLTLGERMRLHQMPLHMDLLLADWNSGKWLPFEDSPSPEVYMSVFGRL
jgi:hypothetical protein